MPMDCIYWLISIQFLLYLSFSVDLGYNWYNFVKPEYNQTSFYNMKPNNLNLNQQWFHSV